MNRDTPAPPVTIPGEGQLMARFVTSMGTIEAQLHEQLTPRTVANFVALARQQQLVGPSLRSSAPTPRGRSMSDAVVGGVLTFGAFDVVVFAAIVYLVTKLVRRVTGAPTKRPKIA